MKQPEILYEDAQIIVCIKPAGVATQTKRVGKQDMESLLKNYRAKKGEPPYIGIVHRLDQPVEGVMVFAKTKEAAADLSSQIAKRKADKYYMAICDNSDGSFLPGMHGRLENYLCKDVKENVSRVVEPYTEGAKEAALQYWVENICHDGEIGLALLKVRLETGRHHQIRVQMAHCGHPLLGDQKYGDAKADRRETVALCSCGLRFKHPTTKKPMEFKIVPKDIRFQALLPQKI
ncbi:MAG: RluA family pseudouridine synthase [Lachnospiraceae bacterium]